MCHSRCVLRVNPYPVTWRIWSAVAQWLRSLVRSQQVSGGFFIDIKSFRSHYGPGVDSPSNRNEYQEYFLGSKGARCVMLTTYHTVPLSRNLGALTSWNPLGLSRPVMGLLYLFLLPNNASKWQMGFNSAFKLLAPELFV